MRRIYRVELIVNTVLGPQKAQNDGVYEDIWEALGGIKEAWDVLEATGGNEPREVVAITLQCIGVTSDKPIILGADGEPLEQDLEAGDEGVGGDTGGDGTGAVPGTCDGSERGSSPE